MTEALRDAQSLVDDLRETFGLGTDSILEFAVKPFRTVDELLEELEPSKLATVHRLGRPTTSS